ncbi:MAG TPA: hypothetical protein VEI97_04400, partial [bacterium]|nr:hypothetical protein [bacterium]
SAGLLAGWLHWTIDFDHTFWLITWTAVCFVATLVTMLRTRLGLGSPVALMPGPEEAPRVAVTERVKLKELQLSQLMGNMAVIVLGFGAATSLLYATSRVLYDRGTAAYDRYFPPRVDPRSNEPPQLGDPQNLVAAKNAYTTAALLWPWGGEAWRGLSLAQFALAARATENSEVVLLTQQAKESATQAAENASYDARNWTHLAKVIQMEQALGLIDTEEAAEKIAGALIIAQIADPINNPQVYSLLAQAVAVSPEEEAKRNDIIVLTVDRFSRFFPPDQIAEYSKTRLDRSWTELPVHYLMLWPLYLDALRGQGDTDGLNKAIDTARRHIIPAAREAEYVPQAVIEPLIQNLEAAMAGTTPTPPEPPMDRADV